MKKDMMRAGMKPAMMAGMKAPAEQASDKAKEMVAMKAKTTVDPKSVVRSSEVRVEPRLKSKGYRSTSDGMMRMR